MNHDPNSIGLTDEKTETDLLHIDQYVKSCASFIMNCKTPMSIAVLGSWGTGKSSFMEMVKAELENEAQGKKAVIVDFNTWQFSRIGEDKLFIPLLTQLKDKIDQENKTVKNYKEYFNDEKDLKFTSSFFGRALRGTGGTFAGKYGTIAVAIGYMFELFNSKDGEQKDSKPNEPSQDDLYNEALQMRTKLQERIDVLVGKKKIVDKKLEDAGKPTKRLVVFVDDLDRLAPIDAVSLLEDMKNFMDCKETVFVMALDHSLVQRGVFEKYRDSNDKEINESYARKFFEKIVQIPFYLPTNKYDIRNYIVRLTEEIGVEGLDPDRCVRTIRRFSDSNPRVIKRALNLYQLNASILGSDDTSGNPDGLFALILLQMCHENIFKDLCADLDRLNEKYSMIGFFEPECYDELLNSQEHHEEYAYLKEVYPYYFQLFHAVMNSTFSEKGADLTKDQQLDKIYELLCAYLMKKGCEQDPVFKETFKSPLSPQHVFKVKRFKQNANITFENVSDRQKYIDSLLNDNLILAYAGKSFAFKDSSETHIIDDYELYIRNVTNNPGVLTAIGKIVCDLLKETEEAEKTVETEPANKSAE